MAVNDKGAGPQVAQPILYNNAGTVVSGMIYAVPAAGGAVSLVFFNASGATAVVSSNYDANNPPASGKWTYPGFF